MHVAYRHARTSILTFGLPVDLAHPISAAIDHGTANVLIRLRSWHMQAAAGSIPDNTTFPALPPPSLPGTPRRAAPRRVLAHPYLILVPRPPQSGERAKSKPVPPHLACLDSTPAAGLHVGCVLLACSSSSSSSPRAPQERRLDRGFGRRG